MADRREPTADRVLSAALGWFSLGLGAAQLIAPGSVSRLIGIEDTPRNRDLMRAIGVRELAAGTGILTSSRPTGWVSARVAGDAIDLALLGAGGGNERRRVTAAAAAVAGIAALDLYTSVRLSRGNQDGAREEAMQAKTAVTIRHPVEVVYGYWRDFSNLPSFMNHLASVQVHGNGRSHWTANAPAGRTVEWDAEIVEDKPNERIAWRSLEGSQVPNSGVVWFTPAPGDRGTEVRVELTYDPPAGVLGKVVAKLFGEEPQQQVTDDLRRLKQVLETGQVVLSEGSPEGTRFLRLARQRPAQPIG
ncbi:MAG TPA: SRPBCC family protein [Actinomycetota bacterium]|nr:SRPBCC family protein [Actinomycetota bacterium]